MELKGEHHIPAPRQRVWEALHDPEILKECITGCESLEMDEDGKMKARVTAKVGPVKATFNADVEILNSVPPESYTLQGEGKGGVAGFAKGSADVSLAEEGEATLLSFHAKANVGGKLAQLGSRLVDSTAKRYAADFFTKFSEKVGGTSEAAAPAEAAEAEPMPPFEEAAAMQPTEHAEPAEPVAAAPAPGVVVPPAATAAPATSTPPTASVPPASSPPQPASGGGPKLILWLALGVVALVVLLIAAF